MNIIQLMNTCLVISLLCFVALLQFTIFVTHDCRFTAFRRVLVANKYMETQLILFEGYRCRITA